MYWITAVRAALVTGGAVLGHLHGRWLYLDQMKQNQPDSEVEQIDKKVDTVKDVTNIPKDANNDIKGLATKSSQDLVMAMQSSFW